MTKQRKPKDSEKERGRVPPDPEESSSSGKSEDGENRAMSIFFFFVSSASGLRVSETNTTDSVEERTITYVKYLRGPHCVLLFSL